MSDLGAILWLIPVLPLLAAILIAFLGPKWLGKQSHWPAIIAVALACALSFMVLGGVAGNGETTRTYYAWIHTDNIDVGMTLRADGLTAAMLVTVTFVGSLIVIFSVGYMHHEAEHNEGYPRFFAAVSLFIASMTGLVLADNYLLLYACWEGVGLCSYLLVGFWFAKPSAAAAARKALLVTRLGDIGLILGIILIWASFQTPDGRPLYSLEYQKIFEMASQQHPALLATACLLLLSGAVGKSAQFPLHVWLPDAMEGPTPVSALIHAATMVTAGVYLVARSLPIFHAAPAFVLLIVATIGAFTALLAALIALTQNDLKRVLAYSTISQLGYMFLALGCAQGELAALAVTAAIFHLMTHAFFKALLFLSAGSVMHAMGNVIDMRRFSGLRYALPVTHWTFLCGALALAGVPIFSGFWSKDEILGAALAASHGTYGGAYVVLLIIGVVTAGLTAFYTFRAYFLTFWGELKTPPEAGTIAHESPPVMLWPLRILAVGALGLGLLLFVTHWLEGLLEHHWLGRAGLAAEGGDHLSIPLMVVSCLFAIGGVLLAWYMYVRDVGLAAKLCQSLQGLYQLSLNKFLFDEIYYALFVAPLAALAELSRIFDTYVVDSLVDLIGHIPRLFGGLLRPIQNGLVQFYALAMVLGLAVFLGALVLQLSR